MTQRGADIGSSIFCIGVGLLFCAGSTKFGDVRAGFPSAGFFPFMGGMILILLSLMQLIPLVAAREEGEKGTVLKFFPQRDSIKRLLLALAFLVLYAVALVYLGFLITTFLFMMLLLRALEPQKWRTVLLTALLTAISSYTLFEVLLKVQLPRGFFGI